MARQPSFQALTIKFNGRAGLIISEISVTSAFDPRNPPAPLPQRVATSALWDTGASGSAITPSLVKDLGLTPIGKKVVTHAGGSVEKPTYLVNIYLPNAVTMCGVTVAECSEQAQFRFILGMDIITLGDFAVTNVKNQTWVSFRTPSTESIDYVVEHNKILFAGVGRNDPCPCGKLGADGRPQKFKKCHGA